MCWCRKISLQDFADKVQGQMRRMFGTDPDNKDYTSIVSDRHYARLEGAGGGRRRQGRAHHAGGEARGSRLEVKTQISADHRRRRHARDDYHAGGDFRAAAADRSATKNAGEPIAYINRHDRPLALYWFGKDDAARDEVLARTVSGGVTVNDCLFHFTQINQPMGGVGASGTGAYHGEWGFNNLSKLKPVFYRSPLNRLADLYPPYGAKIARLEKMLRFMS